MEYIKVYTQVRIHIDIKYVDNNRPTHVHGLRAYKMHINISAVHPEIYRLKQCTTECFITAPFIDLELDNRSFHLLQSRALRRLHSEGGAQSILVGGGGAPSIFGGGGGAPANL